MINILDTHNHTQAPLSAAAQSMMIELPTPESGYDDDGGRRR